MYDEEDLDLATPGDNAVGGVGHEAERLPPVAGPLSFLPHALIAGASLLEVLGCDRNLDLASCEEHGERCGARSLFSVPRLGCFRIFFPLAVGRLAPSR